MLSPLPNQLFEKFRYFSLAQREFQGGMDFVENVIDRSTDTIRGRALFANPNSVFTPGMFAHMQVPASPPTDALLVIAAISISALRTKASASLRSSAAYSC